MGGIGGRGANTAVWRMSGVADRGGIGADKRTSGGGQTADGK